MRVNLYERATCRGVLMAARAYFFLCESSVPYWAPTPWWVAPQACVASWHDMTRTRTLPVEGALLSWNVVLQL